VDRHCIPEITENLGKLSCFSDFTGSVNNNNNNNILHTRVESNLIWAKNNI